MIPVLQVNSFQIQITKHKINTHIISFSVLHSSKLDATNVWVFFLEQPGYIQETTQQASGYQDSVHSSPHYSPALTFSNSHHSSLPRYFGILSIIDSSPAYYHPIFYLILFHHFRDRYFYLGYLLALMMTTERTSYCSVCFNTSPKVKLLKQHYLYFTGVQIEKNLTDIWKAFRKFRTLKFQTLN